MEQETITIPKKKYETMKEELEILRNSEIMADIADSLKELKRGNLGREFKY
ncbi:MAG: hypothetical protein AABX29_02805 [Nanoarchaeota archaeon]